VDRHYDHESAPYQSKTIAVGTAIAGRPPHRSVRAELPHTVAPLGSHGRDVAILNCRSHAFRKLLILPGSVSSTSAKPHNMPSGGPLSSKNSATDVPALFFCFSGTMKPSAPFQKNTASDVHVGVMASRLFQPIRFLKRNECCWRLSASARKVSNRACGLRLRGGNIGLAIIVRH